MKIRFTPSARGQLVEGLEYIRRDNPAAAGRVRKNIERRLRRLEKYPQSGRAIPEFPDLPHREVVIPPYRFFYRVHVGAVWIIAVWHSAQQPGEPPPMPESGSGSTTRRGGRRTR